MLEAGSRLNEGTNPLCVLAPGEGEEGAERDCRRPWAFLGICNEPGLMSGSVSMSMSEFMAERCAVESLCSYLTSFGVGMRC